MRYWILAGLVGLTGCAALAPPPPPPPSATAPLQKSRDAATDIQQKARQREQLNPEASPSPSP